MCFHLNKELRELSHSSKGSWSVYATVFYYFIFRTDVHSSASEIISSAQEILLMCPQHQDLECLLEVLLLAGIICLDNCLDSMEIDVWLEYRGKMMLQKALQDCLFPFQTELIITAPSAIAHHCPFNSSNKPCFAFFFLLFSFC